MKRYFISLSVLALLFTTQAFARLDIKKIPPNKAWGLGCYMIYPNGQRSSENQIASFTMNKQHILAVKFSDSKPGDNLANILVTKVETVEGGGNDLLTYFGPISRSAMGDMFRGHLELEVVVDIASRVSGLPNTFEARILIDGNDAKLPGWAAESKMYCELVPQGGR